MKKTIKILVTVLMVTIMFATIGTTFSMATDFNASSIASSLHPEKSDAQGEVTGIGNQIIGIITTVGVVVAVVVILVLGIKYMLGSASEKAEYKKTMVPYLVGAILIFGASAITKVVVSLGSGINS